jgi:hypothetical protein
MREKPRPNHRQYLRALHRMTPEQRLAKALELTGMARELFMTGLRSRFPRLSDAERKRIFLERLAKCHNRNY